MNCCRGLLIALLASFIGLACSSATEVEQPGTCSLSCNVPKAGSVEMKIEPLLGTNEVALACSADFTNNKFVPVGGPIQVKYKIYQEVEGPQVDDANKGGDNQGAQNGGRTTVPVSGIGFEPVVYGSMAVEKTNEEHRPGGGNEVTPFKYAGIVTPKAEWCSDSCGVITYEVWPNCAQGKSNKITAGVAAGAASIEETIEITVDNGT